MANMRRIHPGSDTYIQSKCHGYRLRQSVTLCRGPAQAAGEQRQSSTYTMSHHDTPTTPTTNVMQISARKHVLDLSSICIEFLLLNFDPCDVVRSCPKHIGHELLLILANLHLCTRRDMENTELLRVCMQRYGSAVTATSLLLNNKPAFLHDYRPFLSIIFPYLHYLHLQSCQLHSSPSLIATISSCSQLQLLDLASNSLTNADIATLTSHPSGLAKSLECLSVVDNPACDWNILNYFVSCTALYELHLTGTAAAAQLGICNKKTAPESVQALATEQALGMQPVYGSVPKEKLNTMMHMGAGDRRHCDGALFLLLDAWIARSEQHRTPVLKSSDLLRAGVFECHSDLHEYSSLAHLKAVPNKLNVTDNPIPMSRRHGLLILVHITRAVDALRRSRLSWNYTSGPKHYVKYENICAKRKLMTAQKCKSAAESVEGIGIDDGSYGSNEWGMAELCHVLDVDLEGYDEDESDGGGEGEDAGGERQRVARRGGAGRGSETEDDVEIMTWGDDRYEDESDNDDDADDDDMYDYPTDDQMEEPDYSSMQYIVDDIVDDAFSVDEEDVDDSDHIHDDDTDHVDDHTGHDHDDTDHVHYDTDAAQASNSGAEPSNVASVMEYVVNSIVSRYSTYSSDSDMD